MIDFRVTGKLKSGENFSIVLKAFDVWHAMNKAKFVVGPTGNMFATKVN